MPTVKSGRSTAGRMDSDALVAIWKDIRSHLDRERARIFEEIRNYPTPIPNCDQDFNHLLEERSRMSQELDRVDTLSKESIVRGSREPVDEFIRSSAFIDDEIRKAIRSRLKAGL
jgi:hypothetical protein